MALSMNTTERKAIAKQHDSANPGEMDRSGRRRIRDVYRRVRNRHDRCRSVRGNPLHSSDRRFRRGCVDRDHRQGAQHKCLIGDLGAGTVEAAFAVAALVATLVLCVGGIVAIGAQLRCIDAAREAARLAARGDDRSASSVVRRIAPSGAVLRMRRDGRFVVVTVAVDAPLFPGLEVSAEAVASIEPTG